MTGDHMVVYAGDVDPDLASLNINDNHAAKGHDGSGITNSKLKVTDYPELHRKKVIPDWRGDEGATSSAQAKPQPAEAELPSTSKFVVPESPAPEHDRPRGDCGCTCTCKGCRGGKCSVM